MYFICYTDMEDIDRWELVSGEDAMQQRVDELIGTLQCDVDDIHVFHENDEII